jgi:hypothetical protein
MLSAEKLADGANSALKQTNLVENPTESTLINLYKDALTGVQDAVRVMKWKEDILRASERQNLLGGRLDVVDLGDVMKRYEIPTLGGPWESVPLQEMKRRLNSGPSPQLHSDERLLSMRESQRTFDPDEAVRMIWLRTKKTLAAAKDLYQQPAR